MNNLASLPCTQRPAGVRWLHAAPHQQPSPSPGKTEGAFKTVLSGIARPSRRDVFLAYQKIVSCSQTSRFEQARVAPKLIGTPAMTSLWLGLRSLTSLVPHHKSPRESTQSFKICRKSTKKGATGGLVRMKALPSDDDAVPVPARRALEILAYTVCRLTIFSLCIFRVFPRTVNDNCSLKYLFWGHLPPGKHKIAAKTTEEGTIIEVPTSEIFFDGRFLSKKPAMVFKMAHFSKCRESSQTPTKHRPHACKCISNYVRDCSLRFREKFRPGEIGRSWAKAWASPWFSRWRILVRAGNRHKIPQKMSVWGFGFVAPQSDDDDNNVDDDNDMDWWWW